MKKIFCSFIFLVGVQLCCVCFAQKKPDPQTMTYTISGVPKEIHDNIMSRLKAAKFPPPEKAKEEILLAIQPFGYFHPEIKSIKPKQDTQTSTYYHVDLGLPMIIIKTDIDVIGPGNQNKQIKRAIEESSNVKPGKIFNSITYSAMQARILNAAQLAGYMKANFTQHEVYVNLKNNQASIVLTLETGPLFYFGPITFSTSPYSTDFLKRFVTFKQGDVYSLLAIQHLQENLLNSKYFSSASLDANIDKAQNENAIPISIETQAVKSQQYNFGLGYGTNTGARTSMGIDLYQLTDTGQHLSTLVNFSSINTNITTTYYIPGNYPVTDQYLFGGYLGEFRPDAGTAYTRKIFTGYETKWGKRWSVASNVNYLHERFSINNDPYKTTDLFYPTIKISRLSSDNPINPKNGTRLTLETSAGTPGIEEEFLQSKITAKSIYPLSSNNFLILRGEAGTTYARDYNDNFPLSMRFFAGGYNSIRGYSYESLGPGKYLKTGSAEIQQRIYDQFYVGTFIDEGNASNDLTQPLERGIGIDFVYRTSVGPISIDIAQANTSPGKPMSIEFNFGADL